MEVCLESIYEEEPNLAADQLDSGASANGGQLASMSFVDYKPTKDKSINSQTVDSSPADGADDSDQRPSSSGDLYWNIPMRDSGQD